MHPLVFINEKVIGNLALFVYKHSTYVPKVINNAVVCLGWGGDLGMVVAVWDG